MRRFLSPGMLVFDIGANAGFYTLAFARLVGPSGRVWAFEPYAENVRNLLRHVELNALENVSVVQAAVTSAVGISGFSIAQNNSMGSISETSGYLVPTISVDEFCRQRGIRAPNLMKIDVEGAETQVLEGARGTLSEGKTVIFLALHGPEQEQRCIASLDALGYRLVHLDGQGACERPLHSDEIVALPPGFDTVGARDAREE
jgi:FkbM family methyltransferase